jgi:hypothetical protein
MSIGGMARVTGDFVEVIKNTPYTYVWRKRLLK